MTEDYQNNEENHSGSTMSGKTLLTSFAQKHLIAVTAVSNTPTQQISYV